MFGRRAVHTLPIPPFKKKISIWLPEASGLLNHNHNHNKSENGNENETQGRGSTDSAGSWIYISDDMPGEEWIGRDAGQARCRRSEQGGVEWWRGCIFLPASIVWERLVLGRWGVVFVVEG